MDADLHRLAGRIPEVDLAFRSWIAPYERYREQNIPRLDRDGFTYQDLARGERSILAQLQREPAWRAIEDFATALCRQWWTTDLQEAGRLRALVRPAAGIRWVLLDVAARCGEALRGATWDERLELGLSAIALEDFTIDYRESLLALRDLWLGAERAGVDPGPRFADAARRAGPQVGAVLSDFRTHSLLAEGESSCLGTDDLDG
jgi:hypothetical protein